MKVEIELTKTDLNIIRQKMGLKTKTNAKVVLQSLIKTILDDDGALTYNQW